MKTPTDSSSKKKLQGIAALYDDSERKELFRKYLFFLGWVEILILAICYLYRLGDGAYDSYGPVEASFPWRTYFLIAFLAPVAITFLIGTVVVGFNKYFGEPGPPGDAADGQDAAVDSQGESGRIYRLNRLVRWLQRLPFLALLLLLGVAVAFFYKLDVFLSFLGSVGEKSVRILLTSGAVLLGVASIFAFILIVLNYQLRKRSMAYQYKSEMAERFGLIILDDNTVLNSEGRLLVQGKKWKDAAPMLPSAPPSASDAESDRPEASRPGTLDFKTSS